MDSGAHSSKVPFHELQILLQLLKRFRVILIFLI